MHRQWKEFDRLFRTHREQAYLRKYLEESSILGSYRDREEKRQTGCYAIFLYRKPLWFSIHWQSSSLDRVEQETLTLNNEGTRKLPCSLFSYCILSSATGFAEEQREIVTPRAFASLNWKRNSWRSTDNLDVIRKLTTIDEKIKNNRSKRVILVIGIERSKLLDTLNFDKKTSYKIRLATSLIFVTENFAKFSRSKFRLSGSIIVTSEPYYSGQLLSAVSFCFVS